MKLIESNSQKIIAQCKKHKVGKLFVFGSILTDRFNEESDVDMVVDFDKAIRNPVLRRNIDNSKVLVYGFANDN